MRERVLGDAADTDYVAFNEACNPATAAFAQKTANFPTRQVLTLDDMWEYMRGRLLDAL